MRLTPAGCSGHAVHLDGKAASELERLRLELPACSGRASRFSPARSLFEQHLAEIEAVLDRRRYFGRACPAVPWEVGVARRALEEFLAGCPGAEDAVLVCSEIMTNAVLHSRSKDGGAFIVRAEADPGFIWLECEDEGGPWLRRPGTFDHPHGLDVVKALCGGDGQWGTDDLDLGRRVVWARLDLR